ncbi:MAG: hypothetical protein KAX49_14015 [Halanaerobiales bacterium]|nr:hypothetical protein [Halanaerobiales bacterium]
MRSEILVLGEETMEVRIAFMGIDLPGWRNLEKPVNRYSIGINMGVVTETFDFWDSRYNFEKKKTPDTLEVLESIFDDALAVLYHDDLKEFSDAFCYNNCIRAIKAFDFCTQTLLKLERLGFQEDNIPKVMDDIECFQEESAETAGED